MKSAGKNLKADLKAASGLISRVDEMTFLIGDQISDFSIVIEPDGTWYKCDIGTKKAGISGTKQGSVIEAMLSAFGVFMNEGFKLAAQSRGYETDFIAMAAYEVLQQWVVKADRAGRDPYVTPFEDLPGVDGKLVDKAIAALLGE